MRFPFQQIHSLEDATRNFEEIEQQGRYTGVGVPTFSANKGDRYDRKDTPTVANQREYINTADGSNWIGIL